MSDWRPSACILCECNCGIEIELGGDDGRRLVRFRGDKRHPSSKGYACEKPHRLDFYQNGRDLLTSPLRRRADGSFEEIEWDTAINEIAERLGGIRDEHGGESIFYYGGGGQGNHLPGAYASATRRALGSRYRSNALAQEKTGQFWVNDRMVGGYVRGDVENCELAFFLGKNPWFSHSIPRARLTLKEIAKDPKRQMIVVDPRLTKTAEMADIHLQLRPGTDAWLLSAMIAILIEDGALDEAFIADRTVGFEQVRDAFAAVSISDYIAYTGLEESLVREATARIANAASVATFEDLGVQMNRHSTVVSYLHNLLWLLTGNFGKPGTQYMPTPMTNLADGSHKRDSPVAGARLVGGLVPCNVIADEILVDHDKRYRAMIVETANPAHSLADSKRMREALSALDTLVVIDVAMTETARLADYVLPASTQFEKAEATFFNAEFPENFFHLRPALLAPRQGPLPEAEIHARLVEKLVEIDSELLRALDEAAGEGLAAYADVFAKRVAFDRSLAGLAPVILYRTLAKTLPRELAEGAVLWGVVMRCAMANPSSLARAGFEGGPAVAGNALFEAILANPSGVVFAVDTWEEMASRAGPVGGKLQLALEDLLVETAGLKAGPEPKNPEFPLTLSAGERRSFTANTIIRDPHWRKTDGEGSLRISDDDARELGVRTGDKVRLTTAGGSLLVTTEVHKSMRNGHVSLPNGMGLDVSVEPTDEVAGGVAPNELTSSVDRDPFVGTPWHKSVPARIERISAEDRG